VTITVNAVNDAPVGVANRFFATEDVVLTVLALNGPLANDTDIDLDTLTVVSQSAAGHGTVSTIAADGSFTYTPDANFNGTDNFIYRVNDGTVTSGPIAIQVVTSAVNDAPNAVNDTGSVAENGPATSYNVLTNDTDVEGNALLLTHVSVSSTAGTVAIVGGQARFTPHLLFWGAAVISYTVSDQHGGTDVGTLTVSVSRDVVAPVATTPVVTIGSGSIVSRVPIAVAWSATDVGVGVTQFQVQISTDGLAFTSLYTGTATTTTTSLLGGHAYRFRVRAVDAEGNVGGYQTTVSSTLAVAFWSNSGITYRVGAWDTFSPTGAHAYAYSSNLNDSASYTFTGSEIVWVGPKSARSGTANVYIDGVKVSTVSLYRASGLSGQQLFKRTFSSSGVHTIKIVVAQAGKWVSLDEFVVLR
jgi:hypothetical protein